MAMGHMQQKKNGAYYTPAAVVVSLLRWVIRESEDRLLDPSCGDGRFVAGHRNSVGVEQDSAAVAKATARAPWAAVYERDFFAWAGDTPERFECAAGNPPFIRYQTFKGPAREHALRLCAGLGAPFTGLTSSWAPFLVATANLLKRGGRMAFVVPAEIGHAPYAAPLLEYLVANFSVVQIVAVRKKLFPELSEDCWLLYAEDFGGSTAEIRFSFLDSFASCTRPPRRFIAVPLKEWRMVWNRRLRPYLMSERARALYQQTAARPDSCRLGDIASVGIGYVSGANDFFHLRPTEAERWAIPKSLLHPTVRNGRVLPAHELTEPIVARWQREDEPIFLLRLSKTAELPSSVRQYLDTAEGKAAREAYKCRTREPWYSVPDVQVPNFFLTYMSGRTPALVRNVAGCTCTNSVHGVRVRKPEAAQTLLADWDSAFVRLSCEIEGHPLGGGMLKLEPREAARVVLPARDGTPSLEPHVVDDAITTMRMWRHYADT